MERRFEEEIFKALNDRERDEAPGPNGFNFLSLRPDGDFFVGRTFVICFQKSIEEVDFIKR